jgi:hypothetical protein
MKQQANKNRQERQFEIGDWVYLKLQPYTQMSVASRSNNKLSFKYFGPYLILERIGKVAYKLQLPVSSKIHPVVHVSQLKKGLPPTEMASSDESLLAISGDLPMVPAEILATKLSKVGVAVVPHILVKWEGLPDTWTSWENKNSMVARYPDLFTAI